MQKIAYQEMFENEITHGWYVGTRNLMIEFLKKNLANNAKILDAGCGTGGTMIRLKNEGFAKITGIDTSKDAIFYAKKRGLENVKLASINKLPFATESFDVIICLDVLYHQGVDLKKATIEFKRILKKGGVLYIQEPAYAWLKSKHDTAIQTQKRFVRKELEDLLKKENFKILKSTYFNSLLFALMAIKRLINKISSDNRGSDVSRLPNMINDLLLGVLTFESKLLKLINLPFGLSIICVARKTL